MIDNKLSQLNMISGHDVDEYNPWQFKNLKFLSNSHNQKRLHHALLLVGSKFLGKKNFSINFARYLLCMSPKSGRACNYCKSCQLSLSDGHPDGLMISMEDPNKFIRVDEIRSLQERFQQTSQQGGNKVCIISLAERMNESASNCLLKILEEPPENTYFILIAENPMSILPTISSRCQRINFSKPSIEVVREWLSSDGNEKFCSAFNLGKGLPYLVKEIYEGNNYFNFSDTLFEKLINNEQSIYDFSNELDLQDAYKFLNSFLNFILRLMSSDGINNKNSLSFDSNLLQNLFNLVFNAKKSLYKNANHRLLVEALLLECQCLIKTGG